METTNSENVIFQLNTALVVGMFKNICKGVPATKPNFRSIYLEISPSHVRYTATNGTIMVSFREEHYLGDIQPINLLIPETVLGPLKAGKRDNSYLTVGQNSCTIEQPAFDLKLSFTPEDSSTFPDYRRVIPQKLPAEQIPATYDADLLASLKAIIGGKTQLNIFQNGDGPGIVNWVDDKIDGFGLIMPLNPKSAPPVILPEWSHER
jgi:DNA polymerase III sliding clamp (beta) subunit (PCNA family)